MAPPTAVEIIRQGLAMGAGAAYLLSDRALPEPHLSYLLCSITWLAESGSIRFGLLGNESADGSTGQVPARRVARFCPSYNVEEIEVRQT